MNKLKGMSAYLLGNIDGISHNNAKQWRDDMTGFLKGMNVLVLDPMNKPLNEFPEDENFRKKRKQALDDGDYDLVTEMMKPTRNFDLRCVDRADFLVCNLDMDGRPFGSVEEISTGNRQKKPIIIHCPQGKKNIPPWAFAMCNHELFFGSWGAVRQYIWEVDQGIDTRDFGRWWFIDWSKLSEGTTL